MNNVTDWEARPKRQRRQAPKTYWEEYVETDSWYTKTLVEDVPEDELWAAVEDEDLECVGEEGDDEIDEEDEDADYEPIAPGALWDWEMSDENLSDEDDGSESNDEATAQVYRTPERKR